ncbi:MAG: alpha-E domain-containing protein [Actinobacteria bacterium]|jgi:uncharacterized alpha-E superfamily protein|nr:alpha-E domain-containing protein [Actinomycetota bacterium]
MLARLAENLFWAGRYVERAEDATRMVDVTYHTLLESTSGEIEASWTQLLEVLHLRAAYGERPIEPVPVIEFLVLDRDNPNSIVTSILRARENARSVRELISSELWASINDLHLGLGARDLRQELAEQPYELFGMIRRACMGIYGVASETMPRDDAWRFMALGRVLERAEMTCRLIDVRHQQLEKLAGPTGRLPSGGERARGTDRADFHDWVAVLKSASAFEAYRRRYRASMDPADVVEFLLLEPDLPRSVVFCLSSAMHQLGVLSHGAPSRAARTLGRVTASLQYRDVGELFELGLHDFLEQVQHRVGEVAEAVADEFFRHHPGGSMQAVATT